MDLLVFIKNNLNVNSPALGRMLSCLPFEYRPGVGKMYRERRKDIVRYEKLTTAERQAWIYKKCYDIVNYAAHRIPFYKDFYTRSRFSVNALKTFDDIKRIPIINKEILQEYDIEDRAVRTRNRYVVNTGGSSGNPLAFYIPSSLIGNEWAHMHYIWEKLAYRQSDLKLTFGGRSDIGKAVIKYDALRHSYALDIYQDYRAAASKLKEVLAKRRIKYLHGYPSAIYEFSLFCRDQDPELGKMLSATLKGAFLGSEYPMPLYRNTIEEVFGIPTISWYGHTERCILAYEKTEPYTYSPFQTYGYVEAIEGGSDYACHRLIGTSYYNYVAPFIRYDTGDEVNDVVHTSGILNHFKVQNGRSGQFVVDRNGHKIPLTGLIFGRHHRLFDYCSHIQIAQQEPGKAFILYVPVTSESIPFDAANMFDAGNVNIDFQFRMMDAPVKTAAGKINLLVKCKDLVEMKQ